MAFTDCIDAIKAAAGKDLSDDQIAAIVEEVQKGARYRKARGIAADAQSAALQAAEAYGNRLRMNATIEGRNAAINQAKRIELVSWVKTHFGKRPAEGLEAILVGVNRAEQGARMSAAAVQKSVADSYVGGFVADLARTGAIKTFAKGVLDRPVARALWAMSRGAGDDALRALPADAVAIAKAVHKWQEYARVQANKAGAWIGERAGFIVTQSHDALRILRAGFEQWKADILPKLDLAAMMAQSGDRDVNAMLEGVYRELTGARRPEPAPKGELAGFTGPANLAEKLSQSRELLFRDADAWLDYNERYGRGNLREAVIAGLRERGEATGLMQVLGTNPRALLDTIYADLHAGHAPDVAHALDQKRDRLDKFMRALDGSMNRPAHNLWDRIGANARALETLSKLGRAVLSQFSDIPTFASEMRYQGRSFLAGMGEAMAGLGTNFKRQDRLDLLSSLGVFFDSMAGEIGRTASLEDPGAMTKQLRTFFKLNLMQFWTEHMRGASATSLSHFMATNTGRAWESLSPEYRRALSLYGIDAGKWAIVRQSVRRHVDGREFVVPEGVRDAPHNLLGQYLHARGQRVTEGTVSSLRDEIEGELRTYFSDRVSFAALEPDAKTRAMMLAGTQRGTAEGELLRSLMQFKAFAGAFTQKVIGRELYGRGYQGNSAAGALFAGNGELAGIATVMAWTTLFGYASMTAKDLAKGREPHDPDDPKTWAAAMVQGGGLGIYGDFLAGEANRFGGGFVETMAGPLAGTAGSIVDLWHRMREGDDVAARSLKVALENTPYANLLYARPLLDYAFLYQLQELMNPGFAHRLEAEAQRRGQAFLLRPSAAL